MRDEYPLFNQAEALFQRYHAGDIGLFEFEARLMVLAADQQRDARVGLDDDSEQVEWWLQGIREQFEEFKAGGNDHLLMINSSGSLLRQFEEPDEED